MIFLYLLNIIFTSICQIDHLFEKLIQNSPDLEGEDEDVVEDSENCEADGTWTEDDYNMIHDDGYIPISYSPISSPDHEQDEPDHEHDEPDQEQDKLDQEQDELDHEHDESDSEQVEPDHSFSEEIANDHVNYYVENFQEIMNKYFKTSESRVYFNNIDSYSRFLLHQLAESNNIWSVNYKIYLSNVSTDSNKHTEQKQKITKQRQQANPSREEKLSQLNLALATMSLSTSRAKRVNNMLARDAIAIEEPSAEALSHAMPEK